MHDVATADATATGSGGRAPAAIQAWGIGKTYRGGVRAVDGVDLSVGYGEILAYLGRNGSGKTTTVRVLTTLTEPTDGEAQIAGHDLRKQPAAVRSAIGVTMQDAALDLQMTGREHLALIAGLHGRSRRGARAETNDLLGQFGLLAAADRLIATYSGGMQRRLDLAGALLHRPGVLFLDEPSTGLDAASRRQLWDQIAGLRAEGAAILLTTQYLEEADVLADRIAVVDHGRIVAEGTADALKRRYGSTTLRVRPRGGRWPVADAGPEPPKDARGWISLPVASAEEAFERLDELRRVPVPLEAFSLDRPTLEDAFLGLTGSQAPEVPGGDTP